MCWIVVCTLLLAPQSDEQKQINKQVSETARKFYTAFESGNLDVMLGMSTVPWYHDGKTVVRTEDVLRVELKKLNDQRETSHGKRVADIKLVAAYALMKDRMPPQDREMLEQVVRDDDYLALVMLKPQDVTNKKSENVVLLVRLKDGKPSVIGLKHTQ